MFTTKDSFQGFAKRGFGAILENPLLAFGAISILAMLDASLFRGVLSFYNIDDFESIQMQGAMGKNAALIRVVLTYTGLNILKVLLLGPFFASLAVYISRAYAYNKPCTIYGAVNFALSKYKRLFAPYLIAQLSIQLGMIICIPGVLFMMQYAFVDAIACLEKEKAVITRSRKMTRGLRGTMLGFILPWAGFSQLMGIIVFQFSGNFLTLSTANFVLEFFSFFIMCSFFMVYEYRTHQLVERRATRENTEPPPRALLSHKGSSSFGFLILFGFLSVGGAIIYQSLQKQNYGSCVYSKVQTAIQNANRNKASISPLKVCEQAKGVCFAEKSEPPCSIVCSDRSVPDISQCN